MDKDYCYNGVLEFNNDQDDDDNLSADSKDPHYAQKQTTSSKKTRIAKTRQDCHLKIEKVDIPGDRWISCYVDVHSARKEGCC